MKVTIKATKSFKSQAKPLTVEPLFCSLYQCLYKFKKIYFVALLTILQITCELFGQVNPKDVSKKIKDQKIVFSTGSTVVIENGQINIESSQNITTLYNEVGKIIEERISNIKSGDVIIYKYYYGKCEEYNRWEWFNWRKNDYKIDTVQIQQMTFDDNCKIKSVVWTDKVGEQTSLRKFDYDINGKKTKEIDFNIQNENYSYILYSYPDNLTIDKKAFFADSSFWYHHREYFDIKGNQIGYVSYDQNGEETNVGEKIDLIYKNDSLTNEIHYNLDGEIRSKTTYFYDSNLLLEKIITNSNINGIETESITNIKYHKRY